MHSDMNTQLSVWTGVCLSAIFSVVFVVLLIRASRPGSSISFNVLLIIGIAMVVTVTLVGNAPYVAIVQGLIISLGTLAALYQHVTRVPSPQPRLVGILSSVMILTLILNSASRRYDFGLIRWFGLEVRTTAADELQAQIDAESARIDDRIDALSESLASLKQEHGSLRPSLETVQRDHGGIVTEVANLIKQNEIQSGKIAGLERNLLETGASLSRGMTLWSDSSALLQASLASVSAAVERVGGTIEPLMLTNTAEGGKASQSQRMSGAIPILSEEISINRGTRITRSGRYELFFTTVEERGFLSSSQRPILRLVDQASGKVVLEMGPVIGFIGRGIIARHSGEPVELVLTVIETAADSATLRWMEIPYTPPVDDKKPGR